MITVQCKTSNINYNKIKTFKIILIYIILWNENNTYGVMTKLFLLYTCQHAAWTHGLNSTINCTDLINSNPYCFYITF